MHMLTLDVKTTKRSRFQIFVDVLRVIAEGEYKRTRIMYKSNLSWIPLVRILDRMIELGLIEERKKENRYCYFITEKGKNFLKTVDSIKKALTPSHLGYASNIDSVLYMPHAR